MATMHSSKGEIRIPDRHNTPEVNTVMLLEMMEEEIVFYLNPPGPGARDKAEIPRTHKDNRHNQQDTLRMNRRGRCTQQYHNRCWKKG